MSQRAIVLTIALFILIVSGMFGFAYLKNGENTADEMESQTPAVEEVAYASVTRITAKHFFIDGEHTLAGEIVLPTPCDLLQHDIMIAESFPEQVTVNFTVLNNAEMCAQVETPARFLISFAADEAATMSATFMGRAVDLNLVPAAPGETPENFELFIKG